MRKILLREVEAYWDVLPPGCSWYCGGRVVGVTASSALAPQGEFTYEGKNIHDFSYKTAWIEGVKGNGIGEFIEYSFERTSARVHELIIANGYVKSAGAWRNNSRVKKLKLYYNGKPYAMLNLKDERAEQVFEVGPFGYEYQVDENIKQPWTLRFEIVEVYPGAKFTDTAISEIHFMGWDEH